MSAPKVRPATTAVNARDAAWSPEVWAAWDRDVAPRFKEGETCESGNLYRPADGRPAEFVYVVNPGRRVCWSWAGVAR